MRIKNAEDGCSMSKILAEKARRLYTYLLENGKREAVRCSKTK